MRAHNCTPRSGFQIIIQLASLMYFGVMNPSWETVSLLPFNKGRVDILQAVQPAVFAFCSTVLNTHTKHENSRLRNLFFEAVREYTSTVTRVSRGKGFVGHLYALQEVVREGEQMPKLFEKDGMYWKTRPGKIMTDCVEAHVDEAMGMVVHEGGYLMPDPENAFVHFEVEDQRYVLFLFDVDCCTLTNALVTDVRYT